MGAYSIKELEKLSGIKAHTLRIWEQRYQVIACLLYTSPSPRD
mgnify:CR=1 FL=1